jgi:hypothetical protein
VVIDAAALLKLAPLAAKQLQAYRRSNLSKSLDRRVRAELEGDPTYGDALLNEWFYVHNDPSGAVLIAGLLGTGDVAYLAALGVRIRELLDGLETLPLSVDETADRLVAAVSNNFVGAQKDETEATQTGTSAVLSAIDPLATREDLADAVAQLQQSLMPPPARVLLLTSSFDEKQQGHLDSLLSDNPDAAGRLAELLKSGETPALAEVVRSPPAWATEQPAAFWRTAGRILVDAGQLEVAERAYVRESESPDVEDRVGALVNAARCAEADARSDSQTAADAYIASATEIRPDHPMVLLFAASRAGTAEERLTATEAVDVTGDSQVARKEAQRAIALLGLRRYDEAQTAAAASTAVAPAGGGRELSTLATILAAHSNLPLRDRDDRPLMDAVAYQLSLHDEALEVGRMSMAGVAGARAALGAATLGDRLAAKELIEQIAADDALLVDQESRSTLFEAALTVGDAALARQFLDPADGTPESRLQEATLAVLEGTDRARAAADLDALLAELPPGDLRTQTVVMRVLAADDPAISLDPAIVDGMEEGGRLIAHAQAARAIASNDLAAARAAVAMFDDPASLSIRSEIAERDYALPEAIGFQASLTRRQPTAGNLLRLSALRARAGDFSGAIRDALQLATDDRKLRSARDHAYALAAQAAIDGGEFEELEDIADRWAELSPERRDPLWAQTFALARQNRHADALAFARETELEPTEEANRHLLWAELLLHGEADGAARMRKLMELSDRFGRPLELERAFIGGVLKTPSTDRGEDDPEVIARFQESMTTFEERFPESDSLKALSVDPEADGADLIDRLAAMQGPTSQEQADARQDALDGLRQGRVAVAFVAAMVGRGTVETLLRNGAHPLAVFDRATAEGESAAAAQALDNAAASWDETACATVAELPEEQARRIEALLPASRIGQAVRNAIADGVRGQMGGDQVAVLQVLPDGTPRIVEENPEVVARIRVIQSGADQVAGRLSTTPDPPSGEDDELASLLAREIADPLTAMVSAFLTARSHQLPVFSDDRVVRAYARALGLPAFGTVALIDAAHRRGLLDSSTAQALLDAVLDLGVWGAALQPDAYVAVARRADFDLQRCGRALLADESLLRVDPRVLHNGRLLAAVAEEAPDRLDGWADMAVSAYTELLELDPFLVGSLLIASLLDPTSAESSDTIRARNTLVVIALRRVVGYDGGAPESDPLFAGVGRWLHDVVDPADRPVALENLLSQLDGSVASPLREALESIKGEGTESN